ncbi:MAG: hypothetical protein J6L24_05060 [Oscillospiraceae bacterium]|nr:hypothetical protein [Oscillospiraceae bacterium]
MKKTRQLSRVCVLMTVAALLIGMWAISVCAVSGGMSLGEMVAATVASGGEPAAGVGDTIEFSMLKGDFFGGGTLSKFDAFGSAMVGQDADLNYIRNWDFRASTGVDTVIRVTAKQNMRLEIAQGYDVTQWAIGSAFYYVTENSDGVRVTVKEIPLAANMSNANFGMQHHLAAGDSLYVIYKSHTTDPGVSVNADFAPWFQVETDAYDAGQRTVYPGTPEDPTDPVDPDAPITDYLEHPYMVSRQVAANGGAVSATLVDYQYLYGDFSAGKLKPFTVFAGADNSSDDDDVIGDPNGSNAVWRWQWRCGSGETVLKLTAKENIKLDLTAMAVNESQWALGSSYRVIAENADGQRATVKTVAVTETVNTADYAVTVHLAKGDSLYIVYQGNGQYADESPATSHYMPVFTMTTAGYAAASRPVFADSAPTTGDSGILAAAAAVLAVSLLACGVLLLKKKEIL